MGEKYKKVKHRDFSEFGKRAVYDNGIETITLISWDEFCRIVKIFNNNEDYYWRGQQKSKLLKSSFDRKFPIDDLVSLTNIFNNLKQKLIKLLGLKAVNGMSEDAIWAIGQHYDLCPTPLLDWTNDPYIAAYFAFSEENTSKPNQNRAVYALNRVVKRLILKRKNAEKRVLSSNRVVEVGLDKKNFDLKQNPRLKRQKGEFTKTFRGYNKEYDIKSIVGRFWNKKKKQYLNDILLAEILISENAREECLRSLEEKGYTYKNLFLTPIRQKIVN